jgi:hypothetical protein
MRHILIATAFLFACEDGTTRSAQAAGPPANFHEVEVEYGMISSGLHIMHDDQRHVTCWLATDSSGMAISCLADTQFMGLPKE